MKSLALKIILVISSLTLTPGWGTFMKTGAASQLPSISTHNSIQYEGKDGDTSDETLTGFTIYLPLITKNSHYIPIFGIEARSRLDKAAEAGNAWLRINLQLRWADIQPIQNGAYDWTKAAAVEAAIVEANQHNLTPILVVHAVPAWARKYADKACGPIKSDALNAFAEFMRQATQRYSPSPYNVKYYQIWNEPDAPVNPSTGNSQFGCWGEESYSGDPYSGGEYFGEMLSRVYPAIKTANPYAQVMLGGLLLDCDPTGVGPGYCANLQQAYQWNFFEGVVKRAANYFDIAAFHGYAYYQGGKNPVWSEKTALKWFANGGVVDGKIKYLQGVMARYGVNKPIVQTEAAILYGDTPPPAQYEAYKADYIVWLFANTWAQGLKGAMWYSMEGWRGSGMFDSLDQPTPAFQALKNMTALLAPAEYLTREDVSGYTKFIYRTADKNIWLLVPTGEFYGVTNTIARPTSFDKALDLFGNEVSFLGDIQFTRPMYVILNR